MPSLFVIQGQDRGTRFELEERSISLGREPTNTIQLHDTEVSRCHAILELSENSYKLADRKSSNGTFVNGEPVQEQELTSGDEVQVGRTLMLYTGFPERSGEDLSEKVDIVSRTGDSSRIVHSISQQEGSAILDGNFDAAESPWLARARSNLQIMYRTALAVSHTLDIDQLLSRIMDMIFEWVEADRGCIMLKQADTSELRPKVRRQRQGSKTDDKMRISQTILDYVVERNEGVLTSNAREDERWDPAQSILQMGVREAICVPMQGRYDVVGVIYIDTSIAPQQIVRPQGSANKFSEEHLKLMIAIAHQAALAVEDTSYYKAMVQSERLAAVGQTIATLSHHIKNILQGVRGGSYLIEMGLEDHRNAAQEMATNSESIEKLVKSAEMIRNGWGIVEKNQEKISTLVLDMLTFSKQREPEPVPSDLNEVTADVVQLIENRAHDLGVELHWNPDPTMPTALFDPDGLHRAVLNVVTNAIDACDARDDGQVHVSSEFVQDEKLVRVVVVDNGSGIAPDDIEDIFSIFVSRKGGRGTGLGLPVSQKILKEHGGQIRVASRIGHGSQFILELPVTADVESPGGETLSSNLVDADAEGSVNRDQ